MISQTKKYRSFLYRGSKAGWAEIIASFGFSARNIERARFIRYGPLAVRIVKQLLVLVIAFSRCCFWARPMNTF